MILQHEGFVFKVCRYDTILINSFFAYPTFTKQFGDLLPNGKYSIPAKWQSGICESGVTCQAETTR